MKTIEDLCNSNKLFLTPADVGSVTGMDPHSIRVTARQAPNLIGFEFTFSGNRMKIPRIPFLKWLGVL